MDINEIYKLLGQSVFANVPEKFESGEMLVNHTKYFTELTMRFKVEANELIPVANLNFDTKLYAAIEDLHKQTTADPINKWNKLRFILLADHSFELEFVWDQEFQDKCESFQTKEFLAKRRAEAQDKKSKGDIDDRWI